jgi:hypothetical protein
VARLALLGVVVATAIAIVAADRATQGTQGYVKRQAAAAYAHMPLAFQPNRGQTDRRVRFLARTHDSTLFLTRREAVLALRGRRGARPAVVRMSFPGSCAHRRPQAAGELQGKVNYFIGNRARTDIPTYREVRYQQLWPGIDLAYYGKAGKLEYDFRIAPGADPDLSALSFKGASRLRIDKRGDLVVTVAGRELRQIRPRAYQSIGGERRPVESRYSMVGPHRVGFRLGSYDRSRPVVIDPVLLYSSYHGGNFNEHGKGIAVDGAGNAYVTGDTASTNFPTESAKQATKGGGTDAFVTKFNATGGARVYSTYLGGTVTDHGLDVAVDGAGSAYVIGDTGSTDFPTQSPKQPNNGGGADAFVTKLNPAGNNFLYSTYLGGSDSEGGFGIAVDGAGNAYVTGFTRSTDFPTQSPKQPNKAGVAGTSDAFVTKFNPSGSAHLYSTYLGGAGNDAAVSIAVDAADSAYVAGETRSTDFPVEGPEQMNSGGNSDAFVTKFNAAGTAHVYSTYLGGSLDEFGVRIALDGAGEAHVVGETDSTNFPTQNAEQPNNGGGGSDAFVTKFSASGGAHLYSTYLGGGADEIARGIALDGSGDAYVAGQTTSTDFPTSSPIQPNQAGGRDAFVTKFNAAGSARVYSTYLGGTANDAGWGLAVDGAGNAYISGETTSTDFPTQGPAQAINGGLVDAFVAKLGEPPAPGGGGPPPGGVDRTAPSLAGSVKPTLFAVNPRGRAESPTTDAAARKKVPKGTTFRYKLSEPARVAFVIARRERGRRVKRHCVRANRKNRKRPACTRFRRIGAFARPGGVGTNTRRFSGRIGRRSLKPGRYRATLVATDAAGNRSKPVRLRFRVVRAR